MGIPIRSFATSLLTIASVFLWAIQIQAQATTASIHGTVTDPTGAVLANALVTAVNTSTVPSSTQRSDSRDYYIFPNLHIGGLYTVTFLERFISSGPACRVSSPAGLA